MGASPKHKYYGEIYFERPLAGIGSVKSYSSDNIEQVLAYFKADAQAAHMKCDAQIYEREKPFGKLEKTRKLSHKEIMGEELTHREKIGIELRNVRIKRGLTIYELGDLCGMAPTTISKIENGRYNVSVDILGKVADALGCKLTFEPRSVKTYSFNYVGKTVGEFRRGLAGSGFKFIEIGNTLISCDANEEHSYDDWMVEGIFIDGMRNGVIEVTARKRYGSGEVQFIRSKY